MATIIANRKRLISAINAASKAMAGKRCRKQVLQRCKLSVNGHVTFSATDIEVESAIDVDCEHTGDADILFDPKALLARIRMSKSRDCKIVVDSRDNFLAIDNAASLECVARERADEHPSMLGFGYKPKYGIIFNADDVKSRIGYVSDCIDPDSTRFALSGILIEINRDGAVLVATDGRRMTWSPLGNRRFSEVPEVSGIIPGAAIKPLIAMLGEVSRVAISIDERATCIVFEGLDDEDNITARLWSRLVEGRFPNWVDVAECCTKELPHAVDVSADDLAAAAKIAKNANRQASTKDESYSGVELQFRGTGEMFWISSGSPACRGNVRYRDTCVVETVKMNVDASFLESAALKQKCGTIRCSMKDGNSALVINADDWCQLIMPMSNPTKKASK